MKYEHIYDSRDLAQFNAESGKHFFDRDTMRFFKSRLLGVYQRVDASGQLHILFITSEKKCFNDFTRVYSLREMNRDGSVTNILTVGESTSYLKKLLKLSYEQIIAQTQS